MTAPEPGAGSPGDRRAAVRRLESTALGSRSLQRLTALAARLLEADTAAVSLLGDLETVITGYGLPGGSLGAQIPRSDSLCAVALSGGADPLVVPDAAPDPRVGDLSPVLDGFIGGYVGVPLIVFDGSAVGTLAVATRAPRAWADADVTLLRQLADSVSTELELSALAREFEAHRLRFELAIDAAEIGSFDWDLTTGRLVWDDRMVALLGYSRDAFDETVESFVRRLHPEDRSRTLEAMRSAVEACGEFDSAFRIVLPSGEIRWLHGRGRVVADDDGAAARFVGAGFDTTRQQAEGARVVRVLESMNAAFFSLDRDWRFDYVNAEAERLLQHSRDELVGGSIWELFPAAVGTDFETHYRGAAATGEERVFEAYYPAPLDSWYEVRAWPSPDGLSVYFLDVSERKAAEEKARRSAARLAVIAATTSEVTDALAEASGEEEAVRRLARAVVPILGDWVIASLVGEDGRLHDVASWHAEPRLREAAARYSRLRLGALRSTAPIAQALRAGRPMIVDDVATTVGRTLPPGPVRDAFEELAPQTAVALSLQARGRTVGALSIYRTADRRPADADDVATMREVADRVALALDNSRLYEQQRRLAEGLQRSLLTAPPEPENARIEVRYRPAVRAAEVGGDWYDAFLQPSGSTVVVIGDVVGHDTEAAAAMGQLRGMLRGIAYRDGAGPGAVLTELDAAIEGLGMDTMATAAIARVEQTEAERTAGAVRVRWSNAGHPPPLVIHPDGTVQELSTARPELMLGVDPRAARTESVVTVDEGATLFLYTDGLVEGRDLPLDDGIARLRTVLAELSDRPLDELCDEVVERLRHQGLEDDIALVAVRLHRGGGRSATGAERGVELVRPRRPAER